MKFNQILNSEYWINNHYWLYFITTIVIKMGKIVFGIFISLILSFIAVLVLTSPIFLFVWGNPSFWILDYIGIIVGVLGLIGVAGTFMYLVQDIWWRIGFGIGCCFFALSWFFEIIK